MSRLLVAQPEARSSAREESDALFRLIPPYSDSGRAWVPQLKTIPLLARAREN